MPATVEPKAVSGRKAAIAPAAALPEPQAPAKQVKRPATAQSGEKSVAVAGNGPRKAKYKAGEDPQIARQCGWPVSCPDPMPVAILPGNRIVAYYGPLRQRKLDLNKPGTEEITDNNI